MNIDEAHELVTFLGAAYPSQRVKMSPGDVKGMLAAYTAGLLDLDAARVNHAVSNLVKSTKWIPTIAEIREAVVDVTHGRRRGGGEAWGDVVAAIRRYGWSRSPGDDFTFEDPIVADVVRAFGWRDLCQSENAIADRARFVDAYDVQVKRERTEIAIDVGATGKRLTGAGPTQAGYRPQIADGPRTGQEVKPAALPAAKPRIMDPRDPVCPGCTVPEAPHEFWCKVETANQGDGK